MKEKNKRTLSKLLGKDLCPKCKEPFVTEGIKFSEHGEQTFRCKIRGGKLVYLRDLFYPSDESEFYCGNCGKTLELTDAEVEKLIKNNQKSI